MRQLRLLILIQVLLAQKPAPSPGGGGATPSGGVTTGVTLTSDVPVLGNGAATVKVGTKTGNTNNFATSTGVLTNGNCTEIDANGNFVDSGAPCGTGSGGSTVSQANYSQSFTAQTSVSLTHNLGTNNLLVKCYDASEVEVAPNAVTIGGSAPYDVTVTFITSFSGRCTVNGGSGIITASPANYSQSFTAQTSVSLTHSLGTSNVLVKCYDGSDAEVQPNTVTIGGSAPYDVTVTFLSAQTGRCAVSGGSGVNGPLYCADAGSNDTYACTLPVCPTAYAAGQNFLFKANTANTGTATANFCALGAKTIYKLSSGVTTTLADNDIRAGQIVLVAYDGTNLLMLSALGNAASGGDSTDTGAHASASPVNDGNLYFPNNGVSLLRDTGAAFAEWGPIFPFTKPINADFSDLGSPTVTTTYGGVLLQGSGTPFNIVGRIKSAPATPYTIKAAFAVRGRSTANASCGILFRESGSGKLSTLLVLQRDTNNTVVFRMTNTTTYAGTTDLNDTTFSFPDDLVWVSISDDGTTNRTYGRGFQGVLWETMLTQGRTTHLTADQVGFFADGSGQACHLVHWKQE